MGFGKQKKKQSPKKGPSYSQRQTSAGQQWTNYDQTRPPPVYGAPDPARPGWVVYDQTRPPPVYGAADPPPPTDAPVTAQVPEPAGRTTTSQFTRFAIPNVAGPSGIMQSFNYGLQSAEAMQARQAREAQQKAYVEAQQREYAEAAAAAAAAQQPSQPSNNVALPPPARRKTERSVDTNADQSCRQAPRNAGAVPGRARLGDAFADEDEAGDLYGHSDDDRVGQDGRRQRRQP